MNNSQQEETIEKLTSIWYELVSIDHHKDRDCHFYINKTFSYGKPANYTVEHNGYISELPTDLIWRKFPTIEGAQEALIKFLEDEISDQLKGYRGMTEEYDDFNVKGALKLAEKYAAYIK